MVGHPRKSCYIFKDIPQALKDTNELKLRPKQKRVTVNMTFLQFGRDLPSMPAGAVPISKGELKVVNADPHHKEKKGLVSIPTPRRNNVGSSRYYPNPTVDYCNQQEVQRQSKIIFLQRGVHFFKRSWLRWCLWLTQMKGKLFLLESKMPLLWQEPDLANST